MNLRFTFTCLLTASLSGSAIAQGLGVTYVADTGTDSIFRLEDLDGDGNYNGAGEVVNYYDETVGSITLGNNTGITVADDGNVFVSDSSSDIVMVLEDTNGDGQCSDAGDHRVYFDGTFGGNASGIEMVSAQNLVIDPSGKIWIAVANTSSGIDQILWLDDLNGDGDANDAGEAFSYFQPTTTGSVGDSIPQDLLLTPAGELFYLENGSTGHHAKGVYRLDDLDSNGVIDPVTEVVTFFIPPAMGSTAFHWGMSRSSDGSFYMADTGNDVIWRFKDTDNNGTIDPVTEANLYWTAPGSSLIWNVHAFEDGSLYCAESQSPDRVLHMNDTNLDGTIDPVTEVVEVYDETVSAVNISNPRGLFVVAEQTTGTAFCFGDGSGLTCPCGNNGTPGSGCSNSTGAGAILNGTGTPSVRNDSLVFDIVGCPPNRIGLFFQGTMELNGGNGVLFGDGLRCAGGAIQRLEVIMTDGTGAAFSTTSMSVAGGVNPADQLTYQFWYRDPGGVPCGTEFNTSNAFSVLWN